MPRVKATLDLISNVIRYTQIVSSSLALSHSPSFCRIPSPSRNIARDRKGSNGLTEDDQTPVPLPLILICFNTSTYMQLLQAEQSGEEQKQVWNLPGTGGVEGMQDSTCGQTN